MAGQRQSRPSSADAAARSRPPSYSGRKVSVGRGKGYAPPAPDDSSARRGAEQTEKETRSAELCTETISVGIKPRCKDISATALNQSEIEKLICRRIPTKPQSKPAPESVRHCEKIRLVPRPSRSCQGSGRKGCVGNLRAEVASAATGAGLLPQKDQFQQEQEKKTAGAPVLVVVAAAVPIPGEGQHLTPAAGQGPRLQRPASAPTLGGRKRQQQQQQQGLHHQQAEPLPQKRKPKRLLQPPRSAFWEEPDDNNNSNNTSNCNSRSHSSATTTPSPQQQPSSGSKVSTGTSTTRSASKGSRRASNSKGRPQSAPLPKAHGLLPPYFEKDAWQPIGQIRENESGETPDGWATRVLLTLVPATGSSSPAAAGGGGGGGATFVKGEGKNATVKGDARQGAGGVPGDEGDEGSSMFLLPTITIPGAPTVQEILDRRKVREGALADQEQIRLLKAARRYKLPDLSEIDQVSVPDVLTHLHFFGSSPEVVAPIVDRICFNGCITFPDLMDTIDSFIEIEEERLWTVYRSAVERSSQLLPVSELPGILRSLGSFPPQAAIDSSLLPVRHRHRRLKRQASQRRSDRRSQEEKKESGEEASLGPNLKLTFDDSRLFLATYRASEGLTSDEVRLVRRLFEVHLPPASSPQLWAANGSSSISSAAVSGGVGGGSRGRTSISGGGSGVEALPDRELPLDRLEEMLLTYFGPYLIEDVQATLSRLPSSSEVTSSQPLPGVSFHEACIWVRRLRDVQREQLWEDFEALDLDDTGRAPFNELPALVRERGFTLNAAALEDFCREANLKVNEPFTFDDYTGLMATCRRHEGFRHDERDEMRRTFTRFDRDKAGELSLHMFLDLMNFLYGYTLHGEDAQMLLEHADANGNGRISFMECLHVLRQYRERELSRARVCFLSSCTRSSGQGLVFREAVAALKGLSLDAEESFVAQVFASAQSSSSSSSSSSSAAGADRSRSKDGGTNSSSSSSSSSSSCSCSAAAAEPCCSSITGLRELNFEEFVELLDRCRSHSVEEVRQRAEFSKDQYLAIASRFYDQCAEDETINRGQLFWLLLSFGKPLDTAQDRDFIVRSLFSARQAAIEAGVGPSSIGDDDRIRLPELLHLLRHILTQQEIKRQAREDAAVEQSRFSAKEVFEFREVFLKWTRQYRRQVRAEAHESGEGLQDHGFNMDINSPTSPTSPTSPISLGSALSPASMLSPSPMSSPSGASPTHASPAQLLSLPHPTMQPFQSPLSVQSSPGPSHQNRLLLSPDAGSNFSTPAPGSARRATVGMVPSSSISGLNEARAAGTAAAGGSGSAVSRNNRRFSKTSVAARRPSKQAMEPPKPTDDPAHQKAESYLRSMLQADRKDRLPVFYFLEKVEETGLSLTAAQRQLLVDQISCQVGHEEGDMDFADFLVLMRRILMLSHSSGAATLSKVVNGSRPSVAALAFALSPLSRARRKAAVARQARKSMPAAKLATLQETMATS